MKIIIDTNIYISYFLFKSFSELSKLFLDNKYTVILSDEILTELEEVLSRNKFEKYITKNILEEIKMILFFNADFYKIKPKIKICRDIKDNHLLDLAKLSNADYIITGDEDLLVLNFFNKTKIIKFNEFIKKVFF